MGTKVGAARLLVYSASMTSRGILRCLLPGVALAVLVGCSPSADNGRQAPPETPEATPRVTDPAAAARLERVRRTLEQGLDVNKADPNGRTALMMAAFEGHTDVVELLLSHGAEIEHTDGAGRTAMMYASSGPFPQTVELLVQNGADVNLPDEVEGWTALMLAAAEGHRAVVEVLLRNGAEIAMTDQDGDAAIDHARQREQTHVVAILESWPEGP